MSIEQLKIAKGFWYLASPYSKWPQGHQDASDTVAKIAGWLIESGVRVFSPITHSHAIHINYQPNNIDWLKLDREFIALSHGLLVCDMPGWKLSTGVLQEIAWFRETEKPMLLLDLQNISTHDLRNGP